MSRDFACENVIPPGSNCARLKEAHARIAELERERAEARAEAAHMRSVIDKTTEASWNNTPGETNWVQMNVADPDRDLRAALELVRYYRGECAKATYPSAEKAGGKRDLLKAVRRLERADIELRRAISSGDGERQNKAGTAYAVAKARLYRLATYPSAGEG